ncbi:MAG: hypothetical protein SFU98_04235 [Leptospiraceae bacterium]|nr:hypothetical protein [Leptospiraceae bacterium]
MKKFILQISILTILHCNLFQEEKVKYDPTTFNSTSWNKDNSENCISDLSKVQPASCEGAEVVNENSCLKGELKRGTMKFYKVNFVTTSTLSTFITPNTPEKVTNCQFIYKENKTPTTNSSIAELEANQQGGMTCLSSSSAPTNNATFRCLSVQSFCDSNYTFKLITGEVHSFLPGSVISDPSLPTRAQSTTTYEPIYGTQIPAFGYKSAKAIPIGFNFTFAGVKFTHLYVSTQGLISFEINSPNADNKNLSVLKDLVIAPWWGPLDMDCNSSIEYKLDNNDRTGKLLTIQWKNIAYHTELETDNKRLNFQVKLIETGNQIEFIYGPSYGKVKTKKWKPTAGVRYYLAGKEGFIDAISGGQTQELYLMDSFPQSGTIIKFSP